MELFYILYLRIICGIILKRLKVQTCKEISFTSEVILEPKHAIKYFTYDANFSISLTFNKCEKLIFQSFY